MITEKQQTRNGWLVFISAMGVMLGLLSADIATLGGWDEALQPPFVANAFVHLSAVIAAFIGGKLIPNRR